MTTLRRAGSYGNAPQMMFAASVVPEVKMISFGDSARRKSAAARRASWNQVSTCWLRRWVERFPPQPPQFE